MLTLLNSTNPVNLVIATLFPWIPLIILYTGIWIWEWRRRQPEAFRKKTQLFVGSGCLLISLPALTAMPILILAVAAGVLAIQYGRLALRVRKKEIAWSDYRIEVWFAIVITSVYALISPAISWMPTEIIKIQNGDAAVGYVISSDPRWLVYMERRGMTFTVPAANVESRTNCKEAKRWFLKPLFSISTNIKSNPDCPK
jgi:hypothetical protein